MLSTRAIRTLVIMAELDERFQMLRPFALMGGWNVTNIIYSAKQEGKLKQCGGKTINEIHEYHTAIRQHVGALRKAREKKCV